MAAVYVAVPPLCPHTKPILPTSPYFSQGKMRRLDKLRQQVETQRDAISRSPHGAHLLTETSTYGIGLHRAAPASMRETATETRGLAEGEFTALPQGEGIRRGGLKGKACCLVSFTSYCCFQGNHRTLQAHLPPLSPPPYPHPVVTYQAGALVLTRK